MENPDSIAYRKAKNKVREIRGFYFSLMSYCIVIPVLIYINLTTMPQFHWFWFSACGWGSALLFQGLSAFGYIPFLNRDWEDRKLRELMEKDRTRATTANKI